MTNRVQSSEEPSSSSALPPAVFLPAPQFAPKIMLPKFDPQPIRQHVPPPPPPPAPPLASLCGPPGIPATPSLTPSTPALVPPHIALSPAEQPSLPDAPALARSLFKESPPPPSLPLLANQAYHPNAKNTTTVNTNGLTNTKLNAASPVCRNCTTLTTPLWRRDESGQVLCNACGLFLKLHGRPRPISLKTDTIKSRNRVKQPAAAAAAHASQNLSAISSPAVKSMSPETPSTSTKLRKEHKLRKDGQNSTNADSSNNSSSSSGLSATATASPSDHLNGRHTLTPLLPATSRSSHDAHAAGGNSGTSGNRHPPMPSFLSSHHVVQPLHYPSSTPAQFAPGLQRITSPLMLLTVLNARLERGAHLKSSSGPDSLHSAAMSAAGALETMAHELGPSATFRPDSKLKNAGVSLLNGRDQPQAILSQERKPVYSALNSHQPTPPRLPALGSSLSLRNSPAFAPHPCDLASLPPLVQAYGNHSDLAFQRSAQSNNTTSSSNAPSSSSSGRPGSEAGKSNNDQSCSPNKNNDNNNNNNNHNHNDKNQIDSSNGLVTVLRTRISELELVNDLFRTRIMELEAMEQAARLRESSMRRRLEEVLSLNGYSGVPTEVTNIAEGGIARATVTYPAAVAAASYASGGGGSSQIYAGNPSSSSTSSTSATASAQISSPTMHAKHSSESATAGGDYKRRK